MNIKSLLFELKLWWKGLSLPPAEVSIEVDKVFKELLKNPRFTNFRSSWVDLNGVKVYLPSRLRGPLLWEEDGSLHYSPTRRTSALFFLEYEKALQKHKEEEINEKIKEILKESKENKDVLEVMALDLLKGAIKAYARELMEHNNSYYDMRDDVRTLMCSFIENEFKEILKTDEEIKTQLRNAFLWRLKCAVNDMSGHLHNLNFENAYSKAVELKFDIPLDALKQIIQAGLVEKEKS